MKRTRLRPISEKRRATFDARRETMEVVRARDRECQFLPRVRAWEWENSERFPGTTPRCFGDLVGHEPLKRSHGADPLDPSQVVLLCEGHNSWVEDWPIQRKLLGL